jgi:hypothetical protein
VIYSQLDAKGKAFTEQERLNKCSKIARNGIDCCQRSNNEKKETLSKALNSFEGKGLQ